MTGRGITIRERTSATRLPLAVLTFMVLTFLISAGAVAQTSDAGTDTTCPQKELGDIIRVAFDKPPKPDKGNAGSAIILPIIGSNPATGFMIGIGGQYGFKLPGAETRFSLISGSVQFTTKNQKLFLLKNAIYSKDNKIFFTGDWRYLIFSQSTYGLGTNAPQDGIVAQQFVLEGQETSKDSLAEPLNFNFLRFYQSASFNLIPKYKSLFLGIGYCYDRYFKIVDQKLQLGPDDTLITSHFAYNTKYGFSTTDYFNSSLNINLVSDTRNNMINAYEGHFLLLSFRGSFKLLGNKTPSTFLSAEWRSFHKLSKTNPRHLIAFWAMAQTTPEGKYPYMILPATGYDQRSRSARGYTQGRFRGTNLVYGETEYRFPLSPCGGVLGGVVFVNASTADNPTQDLRLFQAVKPGYGIGLRVMVDKKTMTNLAIDIGFGEKTAGFYLAASETF